MDNRLYEHPLFTIRHELLKPEDRIRVTYERARLVVQTWSTRCSSLHNYLRVYLFVPLTDLSPEDIVFCTKRFWDHQADPVFAIDPALANIVTCHVNLFLGSLIPLLRGRPWLKPIIERGLKGEILGNLFLTEVGHGLDIQNLETTVTKVEDGFILNTPTTASTK